MGFPPVPYEIKSIAHVLKVAEEHDNRNIVISYWARMYACQTSMKLITGKKPPEVSKLLTALMDWLEKTKETNPDLEGLHNETVANAMIEQYALQLFTYADGQDRQEIFNKNMIKAFYTAGILMDVLEQFGDLSEDLLNKRKYSKWKAAYIHNCMKTGEAPTAGGPEEYLNNVIDTTKLDKDDEYFTSENKDPANNNSSSDPPSSSISKPYNPAPASSPVTPVPKPSEPVTEPSAAVPFIAAPATPSSTSTVSPEIIQKAQKYCKYATSALNYDDVKTAIENLNKALNLLQFGKEE